MWGLVVRCASRGRQGELEAVGFGVVEVHGGGLAADVLGVDGDFAAEDAEAEAGDFAPLVGGFGV